MRNGPYTLAVRSLMYALLCTRPDICFAIDMVNRYQSNPGLTRCVAVKHILKYLQRMRDYMLVWHWEDLTKTGYTNSDFQSNCDSQKSTPGYVYTLSGWAISWRSVKQFCIANSIMELGIPFVKTVTHRIFVIYLDQTKLKALCWCVGVMHWTDLESFFSMKILSEENLILPILLKILILNHERIV